jgi:hypothetical protein
MVMAEIKSVCRVMNNNEVLECLDSVKDILEGWDQNFNPMIELLGK